jgi:hypothetical protein
VAATSDVNVVQESIGF